MVGYIDNAVTTANTAVVGYIDNAVTTANTALKGYTDNAISTNINSLIDGAPGALDTLNELAQALGDDVNFSTTVTNSLASKASLAGSTFTGNVEVQSGKFFIGNGSGLTGLPEGYSNVQTQAYLTTNSYATESYVTQANVGMIGYTDSQLALKSPLASPAFTGTPAAPTAAVNTNTTQVATTAYVVAQIADDAPTKTGTGASGTWGISITGTAAVATSVTATANNTTNETVYLTFVDAATGTQGIETDSDLTYNPSTNVLSTTASSARYADLAEKYTTDQEYEPGTVMTFGGTHEITHCTKSHDRKVAGVISTNPAYMMNSTAEGQYLALQGRVPCKVIGPIEKGDLVVTSDVSGFGEKLDDTRYQPGCVIGKALESIEYWEEQVIEVVVGRV